MKIVGYIFLVLGICGLALWSIVALIALQFRVTEISFIVVHWTEIDIDVQRSAFESMYVTLPLRIVWISMAFMASGAAVLYFLSHERKQRSPNPAR